MSVVDEIKARLDIVEVVAAYTPLKKQGRTYKALCPFHSEKTPSFVVFPDTGTWRCFGACQEGGDIFSFVQKKENLDFAEALRLLAGRAGVELEPQRPEAAAQEKERDRHHATLAAAVTFYHDLLQRHPQAEAVRAYLRRRGLSDETIALFQLGYAPDAWDEARRTLTAQGYAPDDLDAVGLLSHSEQSGRVFDRFRGRLMIPIRDGQGKYVGFGARALKDDQMPKYLNSPQTDLFDKGRLLYALDAAKQAIRARGVAVIVEGYMDALAAHQHGYTNVVASMGTALTEAQMQQLSRLTQTIVLALDADEAGEHATLRGLDVARETLARDMVPVHSPAGLIRFEGRLKAELRILSLPPGKDPDDIIRADPPGWERRVAEAQPLVDYYFGVTAQALDLQTAQGKSDAVRQLAPLVREVADPVARHHYVQKLSLLTHTHERVIEAAMTEAAPHPRAAKEKAPAPTRRRGGPAQGRDEYVVAMLLRGQVSPDQLQSGLHALGLAELAASDLNSAELRAIWQALEAADRPAPDVAAALPPHLHPRLQMLAEQSRALPPVRDEEAAKDLIDSVLRLRIDNLERAMQELGFFMKEARTDDDAAGAGQYRAMIQAKSLEKERLKRILNTRTLMGQRHASVETM